MRRIVVIAVLYSSALFGVDLTPYGVIFYDHWYDTRQIMGARYSYVLFWPEPVIKDRFCRDINAHPEWGATSIQTKVGVVAQEPWHDGMISGVIEGDFLGADDLTISTYRLRYAFLYIEHGPWRILAGSYWHPLFMYHSPLPVDLYPTCYPATISFNSGLPMEPQALSPQLRIAYRSGAFELLFTAAGQNASTSLGPVGATSLLINDALIPNLDLQLRYIRDEIFFGAAFDYERLVPRIVTNNNVAAHEKIDSFIGQAWGAYNGEKFQFYAKVVFAQNASDQLLLSGFGVRTIEPFSDIRTYSNTQAVAAWIDTAYWFREETISIGLFAGGTKNLGSFDKLYVDPTTGQPIVYAINPNVAYVFRVSPRFRFVKKPMTIGLELEYTQAAFGILNRHAVPVNTKATWNQRVLFEIAYVF